MGINNWQVRCSTYENNPVDHQLLSNQKLGQSIRKLDKFADSIFTKKKKKKSLRNNFVLNSHPHFDSQNSDSYYDLQTVIVNF